MSTSVDDIKEEEDDIFEELGSYDFQNAPQFQSDRKLAKDKARQQLAVSVDSPFSRPEQRQEFTEEGLRKLREERAAILKAETREIRRQLDLVKSRLSELKTKKVLTQENGKQTPNDHVNHQASRAQKASPSDARRGPKKSTSRPAKIAANKPSAVDNFEQLDRRVALRNKDSKQSEPKFRPLTGKADCPNCTCDRRSSVCDLCTGLAVTKTKITASSRTTTTTTTNDFITTPGEAVSARRIVTPSVSYEDERPIRPARERTLGVVEVVDEVVVPNRVYTISKSLNEKRTKLAQAIDDLHLMMDQVKERGNKLDQERKLVQLYKDQWKFGPSIGGPSASSRERLGLATQRRGYESRLDPNLIRDSKSLMGFQHIESGMKLRQYGSGSKLSNSSTKLKQGRTKQGPTVHFKSKSLESLEKPTNQKANTNLQRAISNFQRGKASSEIDLASKSGNTIEDEVEENDEEEEERGEEEDLEARESPSLVVDATDGTDPSVWRVLSANSVTSEQSPPVPPSQQQVEQIGDKVQKMAWIPVFGETEIKTVRRAPTKRKVQIVGGGSARGNEGGSGAKSLDRSNKITTSQNLGPKRTPPVTRPGIMQRPKSSYMIHSSNTDRGQPVDGGRSGNNNRVMSEATRKLKVASELLEKERQDSSTKNQLTISKTTSPTRFMSRSTSRASVETTMPKTPTESAAANADPTTIDTVKEIVRLEEMVKEQQKLLERLSQSQQDRQLSVSPITVRCSSPCCHRTTSASTGGGGNKSLIHSMRDRLNKTKLRLAQTLEHEREKHQQLRQKVDSSLRKQSDLENENELLKQSLSKCIDTCLKDISNTFESLGDTLADSISGAHRREEMDEETRSVDSSSMFTNAPQLISDNRHLKQMKSHIETIERQRKGIFEELRKEKQRSNQLEMQLKKSQAELDRLAAAKQRLNSEGAHASSLHESSSLAGEDDTNNLQEEKQPTETEAGTSKARPDNCPPRSNTSKPDMTINLSSQSESDRGDIDDTFNSVDVYRRYIESISPDIESIRRERKMILSEFDNIKKMLSDVDR